MCECAPVNFRTLPSKKAQKCYCGTPSCRGFIGGENANILTDGSKIPKKKVGRKRKEVVAEVEQEEEEEVEEEDEEELEGDQGLESEEEFLESIEVCGCACCVHLR